MRVIGGSFRSRKLLAPEGDSTRPSSDRLRETLFNVLAAQTPAAVWFDLYAGSGAVGIEAISRGARSVYFVEHGKKALAILRQNLRSLEITEGFQVIEREVQQALRKLETEAVVCDVCFLDPPYRATDEYEDVLGLLSQSQVLGPESLVVAEHDRHYDPGDRFGALVRYRKLQQGDAVLSFYRRQ